MKIWSHPSSLAIIQPACQSCGLCNAKGPVYGHGQVDKPALMIIGDVPGLLEVRENKYFQDPAGLYLRKTLEELGIELNNVYFTSIVQCRPPVDRAPSPEEIISCRSRLYSEIQAVNPERILLLGTEVTKTILNLGINQARGAMHNIQGLPPIMATFHPRYVMRFPDTSRDYYNDIQRLMNPAEHKLEVVDGEIKVDYEVLWDDASQIKALELLLAKSVIGIDIETSKKEPYIGILLSHGFKADDTPVFIIPERHGVSDKVRELIGKIYSNEKIKKISHNSTFEYKWLWQYKYPLVNIRDTLILHYCNDERSGDSEGSGGSYHGLKVLGTMLLNLPDWSKKLDELFKANPGMKDDWSLIPEDVLYKYQAQDIAVMMELDKVLLPIAEKEGTLRAHDEVMVPCVPMIAKIELLGTRIDLPYLTKTAEEVLEGCKREEKDLADAIGVPFNINSPKQVAHVIYDVLGVKPLKKTKTPRGTGKKILDELAIRNPDNPYLIRFKTARAMRSIHQNSIMGIIKSVDENSRIHTQFMFHGSDTGRLASRGPNLMNIPKRIGPVVRNAFIPSEGRGFVELDFKQLEFRVAAMECKDPKLTEFIVSGRDVHTEVGCAYFNCSPEEVTEERRYAAKAVVFGVIYGRTARSIADEFMIPLSEAQRRVDLLFETFPGLKEWLDRMIYEGTQRGYVQSMFGRRRRFGLVTSRNKTDVENQSVNTSIQSAASDICLLAGHRSDRWMDPATAQKLIFVHDSILIEANLDHLEETALRMAEEMRFVPFETDIPLDVDIKVGMKWGSLEKFVPSKVAY